MLLLTSEHCKSIGPVKALCTDFMITYFSVWRNDPCIATQAVIDWWVFLCIRHHECRHRGSSLTMLSFNTGQFFVIIHVASAFLIVKSHTFFCLVETFTEKKHTGVPLASVWQSPTVLVKAVQIQIIVTLYLTTLDYSKFQCHGTQTCQLNSPKYNSQNRGWK